MNLPSGAHARLLFPAAAVGLLLAAGASSMPPAAPGTAPDEVTPDAIFGSGNANGGFTIDRQNGVELGMRGKLRFPPSNVFNSNGDGTYTFNIGSGTSSPPNPEWAFEWSVNTDWDGSSGWVLEDLTYEIGMDFDPGAGTNFLAFDHITPGVVIPFVPAPPPTVFWDHSCGDNATPNGGGIEATDGPSYDALRAAYNVAQNSWRSTFFDEPPFSFDPDVPGRYDFYLAAFDGGVEVARTEIAILAVDGMTLALEAAPNQADQDPVAAGVQIAVELWLRNPDDADVSGYQAFLAFDDTAMSYEGTLSSYTSSPFSLHFQPIATAEVAPGELRLDGNTFLPGTDGDALLATLVFTVDECDPVSVGFDLAQPFASETSYNGSAIATSLLDSPTIEADDTAPVLAGCPTNMTQPADAGSCTQAVVTWTDPTASDNCDPSPVVVCTPPSGSAFPVGTTTVTCTATDVTGNVSSCAFDVTITATNAVDVVVELVGSMPTSRCIHFVVDDCGATADATLNFVGAAPAVAIATVEVPCGVWSSICAKDQQHTQWASSPLVVSGASYQASATLTLDGGDTDDDGDIDINDVTLLLGQFGGLAQSGGCPWDGVTRDADFDNDGVIGSPDYTFLTANWLTSSGCACTLGLVGGKPDVLRSLPVTDARTRAADLNGDQRVDVRDVEIFEARNGLSGELSRRMRR